MKKRVVACAALVLFLGVRRASPLDCPLPQVITEARLIEVNLPFSRILGVKWGLNGSYLASDGQQDRFIELDQAGRLKGSMILNLFAFNLTPTDNKIKFNAFDASGRPLIGSLAGSTVTTQLLPNGFLNQGASLAMRPDGSGVNLSFF